MTLMFATVAALAVGLVVGRRWLAFSLAAAFWYLFLAIQTVHLARPGVTSFGGQSGLGTVQGGLYWIVQPPILALCGALVLAGARVRAAVRARMLRRGTGSPAPR
jgi:hypothetical protein